MLIFVSFCLLAISLFLFWVATWFGFYGLAQKIMEEGRVEERSGEKREAKSRGNTLYKPGHFCTIN